VTPFNVPVNIPAHKIGPAFAAGNAVLFKPSPQGHGAAELLVELCHRAGMPRTGLAMVMPEAPTVQKLVADPRVGCLNFTGSVAAGRELARLAPMKRVLLELGGNDPLIVMADADVDAAVEVAVAQRFGTAGQRCTAPKRVFVHPAVKPAFLDKLVARTAALVVGDPADEATDVGPLVSSSAADAVMGMIGEAVGGGARVLAGNRREGNLVHPTVLTDVPEGAAIATTEVFGPVLPVWTFESLDALVARVNGQPLGLQAGLFTHDLRIAKELFERLEVGTLALNDGPGFRAEHLPFGGVKESGLGREGVRYAMREMSYRKTLIL
jgi:acyl-CoA reductase-like NAD-dependent aldehyde dehydrogenase